jgi:hypothetical protein
LIRHPIRLLLVVVTGLVHGQFAWNTRLRGACACVYTHLAEIVPERRLEERARGGIERLAG